MTCEYCCDRVYAMKWISVLYTIFVGIILSITTGFGIAAFYPQPPRPEYPLEKVTYPVVPQSCYATPESKNTPECKGYFNQDEQSRKEQEKTTQKYEEELRVYNNKNAGYTRTAVFFGIAIGALFAVMGLSVIRKSRLVATGLLLAGVLTAILTRLLIGLASLGSSVTGTESANTIGYIEFFILLILSAAVILVGLKALPQETPGAIKK